MFHNMRDFHLGLKKTIANDKMSKVLSNFDEESKEFLERK